MSRLNLDIFSKEEAEHERDGAGKTGDRRRSRQGAGPAQASAVPDSPSPRFVPVGFHEEHLRMLDEAVLTLRREGHWRASKSGIIRALLKRHADHLAECWLEGQEVRT